MAQLTDTSCSGDMQVTGMIYGTHAGNYALCSTPAGTPEKAITVPGLILTAGVHVLVKFSNTNTVSPGSVKLKVNNSASAIIKLAGGNLPSAGTLTANGIYEFTYDGTNWILVGSSLTYSKSDTKVKASTVSSGSFPILATAAETPTSGSATEAVYDSDIKIFPETKLISAHISGTANTVSELKKANVVSTISASDFRVIAVYSKSIPASTGVSCVLAVYSNDTTYADCGLIKVTYKSGTSANALGTLDIRWLRRPSNFLYTDSLNACVSRTSSKSVICVILFVPHVPCNLNVVMVSNYDDGWNLMDSTSGADSLENAERLAMILSGSSSNTPDISKAAYDDATQDSGSIYEYGVSDAFNIDPNKKLPSNIFCTNTLANGTTLYLGLSQMIMNNTHSFDLLCLNRGRIKMYNNMDKDVVLYIPERNGIDFMRPGDSWGIDQSTGARSLATRVWFSLIDYFTVNYHLYVTYGYT